MFVRFSWDFGLGFGVGWVWDRVGVGHGLGTGWVWSLARLAKLGGWG